MKKIILLTALFSLVAIFYAAQATAQNKTNTTDPKTTNSKAGTVDFKGASFGDPARTNTTGGTRGVTRGVNKKTAVESEKSAPGSAVEEKKEGKEEKKTEATEEKKKTEGTETSPEKKETK
ncbi:MAG: hypothetical protein KKA07_02725 [Bacteroidetes bacterium]|nr:hypothetical protein [Bacteroidota bacterium]MBU1717964.1 hypothetical protein [Bacteroidota bacterium]